MTYRTKKPAAKPRKAPAVKGKPRAPKAKKKTPAATPADDDCGPLSEGLEPW